MCLGVTRNFKLTSFHKPGRILPSQTASSERHGSLWLVVQLQVVISVSQPGPKTDMDIIFAAGFLENNTRRLKKVMEDTSVKRTHTHTGALKLHCGEGCRYLYVQNTHTHRSARKRHLSGTNTHNMQKSVWGLQV